MLIGSLSDRLWGWLRGDMRKWYASEGCIFLEKAGLSEGQAVVDFGSRNGNYSIIAAKIVGETGRVYAIDKNQRVLKKLRRKADALGLTNTHTIQNSGDITIAKEDNSVEFVMTYDVLHMLDKGNRENLYKEIKRVLRMGGIFSVYPKHTIEDIPNRYFMNMQVGDVRREIEQAGFVLKNTIRGILSHRNTLSNGSVLNFIEK